MYVVPCIALLAWGDGRILELDVRGLDLNSFGYHDDFLGMVEVSVRAGRETRYLGRYVAQ